MAQESLPNPCGWNKSGKLRKLNYNLPAVDQKRRQTTWIEVHQRFLKPEASTSMKRPQSLLVIVPAFQNFFDRSPWKWTSWRARTLPKLHFHCPNKASSWYWTNSFLDHCHQQSTPKLLGFTSKDPLGVAHPHSIKIFSVQPPSLNHSTTLSRVLFLETRMHVSSSLIYAHVGSQPPQAFTSEKFKQTKFTNMQASANI